MECLAWIGVFAFAGLFPLAIFRLSIAGAQSRAFGWFMVACAIIGLCVATILTLAP